MADFPASGRGGGDVGTAVLGCLVLLYFIAFFGVGAVALGFMIHGVVIQSIWQVIGGAVTLVVLLVVRKITSAVLS